MVGQDEIGLGLAVVVIGSQLKGILQWWFTQISPLEQWLSFEHPTQPWSGVKTAISPAWHLKCFFEKVTEYLHLHQFIC